MLFRYIEGNALCIFHLPCNVLKYVGSSEIFCEISKGHLPPSNLGDPLSYWWVKRETQEESTRVFNPDLSHRRGYLFLKGIIILNIICQELLDWPPSQSSPVCSCSGLRYFSFNSTYMLWTRMNKGHRHIWRHCSFYRMLVVSDKWHVIKQGPNCRLK